MCIHVFCQDRHEIRVSGRAKQQYICKPLLKIHFSEGLDPVFLGVKAENIYEDQNRIL